MIHRITLALLISTAGVSAQWLDHPTPGIPRTADGKPKLDAPVPKAADGKPDLSGLWRRSRNPTQRRTTLAMGPNLEDFMRPGETIPPLLPAAEALHLAAHTVHLPLHALNLVLPMRAAVAPADHAFAP